MPTETIGSKNMNWIENILLGCATLNPTYNGCNDYNDKDACPDDIKVDWVEVMKPNTEGYFDAGLRDA